MNKAIKTILISLLLALLVPGIASAAQTGLSSRLIILQDKQITQANDGNITVVIGSADIKSDTNGSVIVILGKANIKGTVGGDVVSIFGDVKILKNSKVLGNLVSVGNLEKADNVAISGTEVEFDVDIISLFKSNSILINALIINALIILVAGFILISIFSGRFRVMSYSMDTRIGRRMILGALVVISFTILVVFMIFLVVAPILYILLLMFADILVSIFVGTMILKKNYERTAIYLEFFVGHFLISIFKIVPLLIMPAGSYTALLVYGICFIALQFTMAFFGVGTVIDTGFGKNLEFSNKNK